MSINKLLPFLTLILLFGCESFEKKPEQKEIEESTRSFEKIYNEHNAEKLGSFWTEKGTFFNLTTSETLQGREEIVKNFQEQFKSEDKVQINIVIDSINVDNPEYPVEQGVAKFLLDKEVVDQIPFVAEYVKENDKWMLQKLSASDFEPTISHYIHLKELAWLEGNWEDQDENIDVTYTFSWDANKNFLTQEFTLNVLESPELQGRQIIGWDPVKKKIRSWIFDSDGGFGRCYWNHEGNKWYVSCLYTLSDGKQSSSTHVYTKVNEDTYTFASTDREISGKFLPSIGPFKIVRVKK